MFIKAEFILETEEDLIIEVMEDYIYTIFANGESISDYAFIYTRKNKEDEWVEMK